MNWKCVKCGEEAEATFDSCWKCGTPRASAASETDPEAELDREEEFEEERDENAPILPVFTGDVVGGTAREALGIVAGYGIAFYSPADDFLAGLSEALGNTVGEYDDPLEEGRAKALKRVALRAQLLGADAVVGAHFDFQRLDSGRFLVACVGTAVTLEP